MTVSSTQSSAAFHAFPMGPHLRAYLGIPDEAYRGGVAPQRTEADIQALTAHLKAWHGSRPQLATGDAVDLLDELVAMDLPEAVLDLAAGYPAEAFQDDFRAQLSLGVAAMLVGRLTDAEAHFRAAQGLMPEEPAPYVNLVQILLAGGRLDEAEVWLMAGLDAEANNLRLWDLLASLYQERYGEYLPDQLMAIAEKRCSWAGLSLAANLTTTGDRYLKANLLERLYHQGERDAQFLVELTGAHGIAGEFAKIPPLVWQAERLATKGLPWQLHVHCAQAQLAMGQGGEALAQLAKAQRDPLLPDDAKAALAELEDEARHAAAQEAAPRDLH